MKQVRIVGLCETGREMGVVARVKDGVSYAFIRCCEREEQVHILKNRRYSHFT